MPTYKTSTILAFLVLLASFAGISAAQAQTVTADAGGPYAAGENETLVFDASGSDCAAPCDPDGGDLELVYQWDYGDGSQSGEVSTPTIPYSYETAGTYTARVRVTNLVTDDVDIDDAEVTVYVGSQKPVADAGGNVSGLENEPIPFDGSGSFDPNGNIAAYEWIWGDGTPNGSDVMPTHAFTPEGIYNVILKVTDSTLLFDSDTVQATIANSNQPPTASVGDFPYVSAVGVAVQFNGTASKDDSQIVQYDWDFGDGQTAIDAGPQPAHIYLSSGDFTVTLTVTDDDGVTGTDQNAVIITEQSNNPPRAVAIPSDRDPLVYLGVVGEPVQFDGSESTPGEEDGFISRYDWNYGDGTAVSNAGPQPPYTYNAQGVYGVILTVTDNLGVADSVFVKAYINAAGENRPPVADAGGPYEGDANEDIQFDGTASSDPDVGTVLTYAWDFGDATGISPEPTPIHRYDAPGTYDVTLTVNDGTTTDTQTTTASIGQATPPPVADAGPGVTGTVNTPVAFDGSGTRCEAPCTAVFDWDYGDGNSADNAGPTPSHTYTTSGEFPVTLTVTRSGTTQSDTDATTALIAPPPVTNQPPTADAGGTDGIYTGVAGVAVTFDGSGSSDDSAIDQYDWDYGDGTATAVDAGPTPQHTYADSGQYTVRLTVTDDDGVPASDDATARIDLPAAAPTARPGGPYNGVADVPIEFDGSGSIDPDGTIVQYDWDYGDGNSANDAGPTPSHTYASVGQYTVSLTVTDNDALTDTQTTSAVIATGNQAPVADAGAKAYPGLVGVAVQFDGTGSSDPDGDALTYTWDFGDGSPRVNGVSPTHVYATAGPFGVVMQATDGEGATSAADTIALIGSGTTPPVADAGGPYAGQAGTAIDFDGSASSDPDGGRLVFIWDFDFGNSVLPGSGPNPSHVYDTAGTKNVTLTVIDDSGTRDSASTQVVVASVVDRAVGTIVASPDPVLVDGEVTYTIPISNNGPSSEPAATASVTLPTNATFVSANASQGTCAEAAGVVDCDLGAIANGGGATISVVVTAPAQAGSLMLSATVDGQAADSTPGNDSGSVTSRVNVSVTVQATSTGAGSFGFIELLLAGLAVALLRVARVRRKANAGAVLSLVVMGGLVMGSPQSSQAAEFDWIVGLGAGSTSSDYDGATFATALAPLGHTVSNLSVDDSGTGYKVFGDLIINQYFGAALGYVDLDETTVSFDVETNDPAQLVADAGVILPTTGSGVSFAAMGRYPFGDRGAIFAKLGGFAWEADAPVSITSGGVSESGDRKPDGTDLVFGVGGDLYFPDFIGGRLGGRLEWERYQFDNNDVDLVSVLVLFRF